METAIAALCQQLWRPCLDRMLEFPRPHAHLLSSGSVEYRSGPPISEGQGVRIPCSPTAVSELPVSSLLQSHIAGSEP